MREISRFLHIKENLVELNESNQILDVVSQDRFQSGRVPIAHVAVVSVGDVRAVQIVNAVATADARFERFQFAIRKDSPEMAPGDMEQIDMLLRTGSPQAVIGASQTKRRNIEALTVERDPSRESCVLLREVAKRLFLFGVVAGQELDQPARLRARCMEKSYQKEGTADETEGLEIEEEVAARRPPSTTAEPNAVGQDTEGVPRSLPPRFRKRLPKPALQAYCRIHVVSAPAH